MEKGLITNYCGCSSKSTNNYGGCSSCSSFSGADNCGEDIEKKTEQAMKEIASSKFKGSEKKAGVNCCEWCKKDTVMLVAFIILALIVISVSKKSK